MNPIEAPFPLFFDKKGNPLSGGSVYIGAENQNPETNPISVYWDAAGTQPALQPLKTANGLIVRNGAPALVYATAPYSMTVRDSTGAIVFPLSSSGNFITSLASSIGSSLVGFIQAAAGAVWRTLQDVLRERVTITDFGAVAGAAYNTVNPSGKTNDQAFLAAIASGRSWDLPEGTFETSEQLVLAQFTRLTAHGRWKSAINFRTDINPSAGLWVNGHTDIAGDLAILGNGGTGRIGTGVNFSNTTVNGFTGDINFQNLRVSGFNTGVNFNNIYWLSGKNLYTYNCTTGIEMSPTTDGGDNGYTTTIEIDNWYAVNNDTYHIHANPAGQNANLHFTCAKMDNLTASSGTKTAKAYFHNAKAMFMTLYAENDAGVPALNQDGGNIAIHNLYLSSTGGIVLTSTPCNLSICNGTTSAAGDIIYAANAANKVSLFDCNFPAAGNTITGDVLMINSYVNGIQSGFYQTGNPASNAMLFDNSPLGAGVASPGFQWKNGDAQRFSIQMSGGVGAAAAVNFVSSDGAIWTFSANAPVVSLNNFGFQVQSANGATSSRGHTSELLTLSTSGTTTDTTANLLPQNAVIEAVVARVVTALAGISDWKLGDPTTAGRFSGASTALAAGSTVVGTVQADQTGAAGPRQTTNAKVRVTTTGTPSAGQLRITSFYRVFVAPTS